MKVLDHSSHRNFPLGELSYHTYYIYSTQGMSVYIERKEVALPEQVEESVLQDQLEEERVERRVMLLDRKQCHSGDRSYPVDVMCSHKRDRGSLHVVCFSQ